MRPSQLCERLLCSAAVAIQDEITSRPRALTRRKSVRPLLDLAKADATRKSSHSATRNLPVSKFQLFNALTYACAGACRAVVVSEGGAAFPPLQRFNLST